MSRYVIWSFEHDAWWRPGAMGYTPDFDKAGRYGGDEAARIVADANIVHVNEEAIPEDEAAVRCQQRRFWVRLAMPGVYADPVGGLHLVMDELLAGAGYADTPDNRRILLAAAREAFGNLHFEE